MPSDQVVGVDLNVESCLNLSKKFADGNTFLAKEQANYC